MTNRWVRFLLAVLAIAAAAAAAYRVLQDEQRLARDITATRGAEFSSQNALSTVEELKAALHAYVAPGQGSGFWTTRAAMLLDKLRSSLLELDTAVRAQGGSMADVLDAADRLAAAEQRARDHVQNGQPLLAGDVIFNDARDLLDSARIQIARARDQIAAAAAARQSAIRREQMWLVGGAVGILAFVMLLLVPPGRRESAVISPPPVAEQTPAPASVSPPAPLRESSRPGMSAATASELATLCAELAAVSESREIEPLLNRARALLNARGAIIWMSTPDRLELHSAAASGYDARVVARLGSIRRDASNLTADAFRENAPRSSAAAGGTAAALAIPLASPEGPAGVFSAELNPGFEVDEATLSTARVIAAQLGALLGSIPSEQPQVSNTASSERT